nr:MAG TPA: hypothetical protein [Caudoviricetes sp.]
MHCQNETETNNCFYRCKYNDKNLNGNEKRGKSKKNNERL